MEGDHIKGSIGGALGTIFIITTAMLPREQRLINKLYPWLLQV